MSARVCNPVALSEITKLRSPAVVRRPTMSGSSISLARVTRNLFGPVDKEEAKNFIDRQLAAQSDALSKKWGFDFAAGQPLQNHDQYKWERVPPTSAPACFAEMVTLTRAAHFLPQSATIAEDLLDQRAERENGTLYRHPLSSISSPASVSGSDSESDCSFETVRTYPLVLRSETIASVTITATTTTSSSSSASTSPSPATINRAKRQQRITDFLKERKRLSTGTPKSTAAKKARQMLMPSSASSSNATAQQQDH